LLIEKQVNDFERRVDAILNDEKVRWVRANMMIVGKGAGGKSSMIRTHS